MKHTHICNPWNARHFGCFKKVDTFVAKILKINGEAEIKILKNFKCIVVEVRGYENVLLGRSVETTLTKYDNSTLGLKVLMYYVTTFEKLKKFRLFLYDKYGQWVEFKECVLDRYSK